MDANQKNYKGQVEINDLIDNAINNAVARRHQSIDSQDVLSALFDEEARSISGGIANSFTLICPPTWVGKITDPDYSTPTEYSKYS